MNNILFKVHVPNGAGIGNTLKGFISGLTVNNNTKIECNPRYILGNFDSILDSKYILSTQDINNNTVESFSSCRWLILKEEENIQKDLPYEYSNYNEVDLNNSKYKHLLTSKVTIDHYYNRSLISDCVFERFMKVIKSIKFTDIIYDEVNKFNKFNFDTTLGISVRTWNASHEHNVGRKYSFDTYKNTILDTLTINPQIDSVFISFDNESVEKEYTDLIKNINSNIKLTIYREHEHAINHLQYVMIKVLLLSKCGYFICSRISTFSELVFWFSECKQDVTPLF